MKTYIAILTLLICSYANGQDTALFKRIDSIVAKVDLTASTNRFDTLKASLQNGYPPGTTSNIFLLKQGREVRKIYSINTASNAREFTIFENGKPVFRQVFTSSAPWKFYFVGEIAYLYIKEDNRLVTLSSKFDYDQVDGWLRLFKDQ